MLSTILNTTLSQQLYGMKYSCTLNSHVKINLVSNVSENNSASIIRDTDHVKIDKAAHYIYMPSVCAYISPSIAY
jgi:hypothetical protein